MKNETPSYPTLAPYLGVSDGAKAIEFYVDAFGAKELFRLTAPDSKRVCHAELEFPGSGFIMLAEEFPGYSTTPAKLGGTPVRLALAVENADQTIEKATKAGAKLLHEASDQFYGMRSGTIEDPFGHIWLVQHETEKVTHAEMTKRFSKMCESMEDAK